MTTTVNEYEVLGRELSIAREKAHLTQTQAACEMGISQPTLSLIESGLRRVRVVEMTRFLRLYGVPSVPFLSRPPSPRRRVLSHIFRRAPYESEALGADLLHMSSQQLERIAATIIHVLAEREREEEAQS